MKGLQLNPATALPGKIKELVGLAVSAQIPCEYCVYAHTEFAKLNGATDAEIGEAVVMGALTRRWSTVANGLQVDEAKFRSEIAQVIANMKKGAAGGAAPAEADGGHRRQDRARRRETVVRGGAGVPAPLSAGRAGGRMDGDARRRDEPELCDPGQIQEPDRPGGRRRRSRASSASSPTRSSAKLEGASERELSEAVAMAGATRHWSTILNGRQIDKAAFKKDISRLVAGAHKHMAAAAPAGQPMTASASR